MSTSGQLLDVLTKATNGGWRYTEPQCYKVTRKNQETKRDERDLVCSFAEVRWTSRRVEDQRR